MEPNEKNTVTEISALPSEAVSKILSFLSGQDLLSSMLVSKSWHNLSLEHQFWSTLCVEQKLTTRRRLPLLSLENPRSLFINHWVLQKRMWGEEKFWKSLWLLLKQLGCWAFLIWILWALAFLYTFFRLLTAADASSSLEDLDLGVVSLAGLSFATILMAKISPGQVDLEKVSRAPKEADIDLDQEVFHFIPSAKTRISGRTRGYVFLLTGLYSLFILAVQACVSLYIEANRTTPRPPPIDDEVPADPFVWTLVYCGLFGTHFVHTCVTGYRQIRASAFIHNIQLVSSEQPFFTRGAPTACTLKMRGRKSCEITGLNVRVQCVESSQVNDEVSTRVVYNSPQTLVENVRLLSGEIAMIPFSITIPGTQHATTRARAVYPKYDWTLEVSAKLNKRPLSLSVSILCM